MFYIYSGPQSALLSEFCFTLLGASKSTSDVIVFALIGFEMLCNHACYIYNIDGHLYLGHCSSLVLRLWRETRTEVGSHTALQTYCCGGGARTLAQSCLGLAPLRLRSLKLSSTSLPHLLAVGLCVGEGSEGVRG